MVERSISWLVAGRNRRLRFVGTRLNDLWLHHRVAALNLRRLLALGLTRRGGSWVLPPLPGGGLGRPRPRSRSNNAATVSASPG